MDNEILAVRDMAMAAQKMADQAMTGISSHELVCAERYTNIKDRLAGIPRLFEIMEKTRDDNTEAQETIKSEINANIKSLQKNVYIGMGILIGINGILNFMHH